MLEILIRIFYFLEDFGNDNSKTLILILKNFQDTRNTLLPWYKNNFKRSLVRNCSRAIDYDPIQINSMIEVITEDQN